MKRSVILLTFVVALAGTGIDAAADSYFRPWVHYYENEGRLKVGLGGSYYSTGANYTASGSLLAPARLDQYSRIQTDLNLAFAPFDRMTLFGRASWARVGVSLLSPADQPSSYGLTQQMAGVSFRIHTFEKIGLTLDAQAQLEFPVYDNARARSNSLPFLGDGSIDATGGVFTSIPIDSVATRKWVVTTGVGFTYRTQGFSQHLPWSFFLSHRPPERSGVIFDVGAYGILSLRSDLTDPAGVDHGGTFSHAVQAINSSHASVWGRLGYQFNESWTVVASASRSFWGQNAPMGLAFGAQAEFRLGGGLSSAPAPALESAVSKNPSNQGFVTYAIEANVKQTNDRLNLVKIDRGKQDGVEVGQNFDIFSVGQDGRVGEVVARASVISVKTDEAALKITEYFREIWIEEGFLAKRVLQ